MKREGKGLRWLAGLLLLAVCLTGFAFSAKADVLTPVLKGAKVTDDGAVEVTWKAVTGAEKYRVFRKTASGKWIRIANLDAVTSYKDTTAVPTVEYTYTVRALIGTAISGYDETGVKATVPLQQPKLIGAITKSSTSLKVMWEKVPNASYYNVYRLVYGETNKFEKVASKVKTTYYTDKNLKADVTYVYTVRAAVTVSGKSLLSDYKNSIKAKIQPESEITLNSPKLISTDGTKGNTITVTWSSVPEADAYYVYRKNGTSWKRVSGAVKQGKTSWTDKNVTTGTTYTYTVRAYLTYNSKKIYSTGWDTKGITGSVQLGAPKLISATPNMTSSITITWGKVDNAAGYRVYRKTASTKWKRIASGNALTYTDKKIKTGVKYTYTVRAYQVVNGKTKLGAFDADGISTTATITKKTSNGLELYYDGNGKLITDTSSIIGSQSSYAIEVDWNKNVVTVYAKGSTGSYNLPVKAFICSTGEDTPIGTYYTPEKYRWHELNGPCWGQWCTRIHGGVLFHSVYYNSYNNNMDLSVSAYNKLGTKASHGCVRLTAGDAKWIYDNCRLGTKVIIKKNCANPFGKPTAYKLAKTHTWDPTDPAKNVQEKCAARGCH